MRKPIIVSGLIMLIFFILGCATHEKQLQEKGLTSLTQADLEKLFSADRVATARTVKTTATVKYYPDGKQEVAWSGGSDTGTYKLQNASLCSSWKVMGDRPCVKLYKIDVNKYDYTDPAGNLGGTLEFK